MNLKNVNFIEQHLEKIILGVGAVLAIAVLVLYVVGTPYSVEIDGGKVAASDVEGKVKQYADKLKRELAGQRAPEAIAEVPVAPYTKRFTRRDRSTSRVAKLPLRLGASAGQDANDLKFTEPILVEYRIASPPQPQELVARAEFAVLKTDRDVQEIYAEPVLAHVLGDRLVFDPEYGRRVAVQYAKLIQDEEPRDFEFVSVMAEFDWEAWQKLMEAVPESDRFPKEWWQGQYYVADVILERQVQDPDTGAWGGVVDGQWQADQVHEVEPLPGALSFRHRIEALTPFEIRSLVRSPGIQEQIVRPVFCPTVGLWLPPDEHPKKRTVAEERHLMRVNKEITVAEQKLVKLEAQAIVAAEQDQKRAQAQQVRQAAEQRTQTRLQKKTSDSSAGSRSSKRKSSSKRSTSRGARAGARGESMGGRMAMAPKTATQEVQQTRQKLEVRLTTLYLEREELLFGKEEVAEDVADDGKESRKAVDPSDRFKQLRLRNKQPGRRMIGDSFGRAGHVDRMGMAGMGMGAMMPGRFPGHGPDPAFGRHQFGGGFGQNWRRPARRHEFDQRDPQQVDEDPLKTTVWAHDIAATPGKTYRYRLRVAVLNPLYQRHARLVEAQKHLADDLALPSEPTVWTEAIKIHPSTYFYLVRGSRRNAEGTVEVYRIFNGKWRRHEFTVRAGEPIGGVRTFSTEDYEREVDLSVGAIVVAVDPEARSQASVNRTTVKLVYLDVERDRLMQRTAEQDKDDETRVYLRNQSELEDEIAEMARSGR